MPKQRLIYSTQMCVYKIKGKMCSIVQGVCDPESNVCFGTNLFARRWWRRRWRWWGRWIIAIWWCTVLGLLTITIWLRDIGCRVSVGVAAAVAGRCWGRLIRVIVIVMIWIARSRLIGGIILWVNVATGPRYLGCGHCIWNIINYDWMQTLDSHQEF